MWCVLHAYTKSWLDWTNKTSFTIVGFSRSAYWLAYSLDLRSLTPIWSWMAGCIMHKTERTTHDMMGNVGAPSSFHLERILNLAVVSRFIGNEGLWGGWSSTHYFCIALMNGSYFLCFCVIACFGNLSWQYVNSMNSMRLLTTTISAPLSWISSNSSSNSSYIDVGSSILCFFCGGPVHHLSPDPN